MSDLEELSRARSKETVKRTGRMPRMGERGGYVKSWPESNRLIGLPILPFGRFTALNVLNGHSPRQLAGTASNVAMTKSTDDLGVE